MKVPGTSTQMKIRREQCKKNGSDMVVENIKLVTMGGDDGGLILEFCF